MGGLATAKKKYNSISVCAGSQRRDGEEGKKEKKKKKPPGGGHCHSGRINTHGGGKWIWKAGWGKFILSFLSTLCGIADGFCAAVLGEKVDREKKKKAQWEGITAGPVM